MVVVTEGHSVVGTVTKLFDTYSWVTLITDPNSAVSAMVQESRAQGVVTGSYSRKLSIEFVAQGAAVKDGDVVITSAIGGLYPAGLVIGKVTDVGGTAQDLFKNGHGGAAGQPLPPGDRARADQLRADEPGDAMRYVLAVLLFWLVALVQTSVMPAFPVFGVVPNLVLALAVCWTVVRGQQEAMVVVPMAGVLP